MRTRTRDDVEYDYGEGAQLSVTVNVHVSAEPTVEMRTFVDEGRVTVTFEGYRRSTDVTLFLHTGELRELRDLLGDTLTALTDPADTPVAPGGGAGGV